MNSSDSFISLICLAKREQCQLNLGTKYCETEADASVHFQNNCSVVCWKSKGNFGWNCTNIQGFRGIRRQMLTSVSQRVCHAWGTWHNKMSWTTVWTDYNYQRFLCVLSRIQGSVHYSKLQWLQSDMFWLKQPGRITLTNKNHTC